MQPLHASLRQSVLTRMQADSAHDLAHLDRVWATAKRIATAQGGANLKVLLGAAYLHDLVNLPKDAPNRAEAAALSANAAAPILRDLGFSANETLATQHCIKAHSFSAGIPPQSPEAEILRDADRLDALGAIGIARTFSVAGALGRAIYDAGDPFAANRSLDDQVWSIDHWHLKLLQLPRDMLTTKGREIADRRARLMLAYLEQLADEIDVPLPDQWADLLA